MNDDKHLVFQIQHYSLHDGPGIRTIVFLKGCPLRCKWCCNPESQLPNRQVSYESKKCIGKENCGWCIQKAKELRSENFEVSFDENGKAKFDLVNLPEEIVFLCPANALKFEGKEYSVSELLDIVEQDSVFYNQGEGGLTVSGGEPLLQGDFLISLLKSAQERRIHTAMETCGYGDYKVLYEAAKYLDYILFDIKSLNDEKHKQFTGKSNKLIVQNFVQLCKDYPLLQKKVRTPVIPGFNDDIDSMKDIVSFLKDFPNIDYEPLKYHKFGEGKYHNLGREYPMGDVALSEDFMDKIYQLVEENRRKEN